MGGVAAALRALIKNPGDAVSPRGKLPKDPKLTPGDRRAIDGVGKHLDDKSPKETSGDDPPGMSGPLRNALHLAGSLDEKRTNAFLGKLGYRGLDDPKLGAVGDYYATAWVLGYHFLPAAIIASHLARSPGSWEEQQALRDKQNLMTAWLIHGDFYRGSNPQERAEREALVAEWERRYPDARAYAQRWRDSFHHTEGDGKEFRMFRDSLLGIDKEVSDMINAGPPARPRLQRALDTWEVQKRQSWPKGSTQQPRQDPPVQTQELLPGSPEWEQEKQRRFQQWRERLKDQQSGPRSDLAIPIQEELPDDNA